MRNKDKISTTGTRFIKKAAVAQHVEQAQFVQQSQFVQQQEFMEQPKDA